MNLKLYNTYSASTEVFKPIDPGHVRMYVCGPTVYDRAHIGNARPAVVFDVLYRVLKTLYKKVTYVRNITDIDDKIYKAALEKNISISELTEQTTKMYHEDILKLNVLPVDIEPRATEHIHDMIRFVEELIKDGNAYVSNNHIYFDVSSFSDYGKLSKKNKEDLIAGARIEISEFKRSPLDFVLWKPIDETFNFGWDSPWGKGRPGWHLECSVMSHKYLGKTFDIHGGGIDLVFPHHENEIAQSCAHNHTERMANYWIHNGHLNINGVKMSKSLGNFFTVHELLEKYNGEVIRFAFLMTHYTSPINFTFDLLTQAKNILTRWYCKFRNFQFDGSEEIDNEVLEALLDNLNTPKAISILNSRLDTLCKSQDSQMASKFINTCRKLLGVMELDPKDWFCQVEATKCAWIEEKIKERNEAKKQKDYQKADSIRDELKAEGILIEDTKSGTIWKTL